MYRKSYPLGCCLKAEYPCSLANFLCDIDQSLLHVDLEVISVNFEIVAAVAAEGVLKNIEVIRLCTRYEDKRKYI